MKTTLSILFLLGTLSLTDAFTEHWCESCVYAYIEGIGRVYNCFNESPNGRICPPDHKCYSLQYKYDKTGMNLDLGLRDPPPGAYTWIMQGCIFAKRDPQYLCKRTTRQFANLAPTENHQCEIEVCDGDKCNQMLTDNYVAALGE